MVFLFGNQKILKELSSLRQAIQETKEAAEAAQSAAEVAKNAVEAAKDIVLHTGPGTVEGVAGLRQAIQEAKTVVEAIQRTELHTGSDTIGNRDVLSSDKTEVPMNLVPEPVSGTIVCEDPKNVNQYINKALSYLRIKGFSENTCPRYWTIFKISRITGQSYGRQ